MELIIIITVLVIAFALLLYHDYKRTDDLFIKLIKEHTAWASQERDKPKYYISFMIDGRDKHTPIYHPHQTCPGALMNIQYTSEDMAYKALAASYKRGYFIDDKNITYPSCNVTQAVVQIEPEHKMYPACDLVDIP